MQIGSIDIPEPLLSAQRNGSLVIFAGAGVSMGPPANYPSFPQLALQVSGDFHKPEEQEPTDRFLGRLENLGVPVHRETKRILTNPTSRYTPLHADLLRLFGSTDRVRLVTTNFDVHFTTAAKHVFGADCRQFHAPALPLGHDFFGIVYLHGSVDQEEKHLVLTDRDFGRAYLTEGWARRFLLGLFANYTVLFVGYSHSDVVMNYLSRGLPPDTQKPRFALTSDTDSARWKFLGVTPVVYPLKNGGDHSALGEAISKWAQLAQMGAIDHERRIADIVTKSPPLEQETIDYVRFVLGDLSTVRFFTRYAKTPEWLHWAEQEHVFDPLFGERAQLNEIAREIALWFAQSYSCAYPEHALALIERRQQGMGTHLWSVIAHHLHVAKQEGLDPAVFAKWVMVLVASWRPGYAFDPLNHLLAGCKQGQDDLSAVLLFEHLTRPRAALKARLRSSDEEDSKQVDLEIEFAGDSFWLQDRWERLFRRNLGTFAEKLLPIITANIQQAHLLLRAAGQGQGFDDLLSLRRSAIEPHPQDEIREPLDALIDAARDILEWLLINKAEAGRMVIETWANSEAPLLRRLAIHGVAKSLSMSPEEKTDWLSQRNWLYVPGFKHEVYRLLEQAYPKLDEDSRATMLDQVEMGPQGPLYSNIDEETLRYEAYNLLLWLSRVAPDCEVTQRRFAAMQAANPEYAPREHPEFGHFMTIGFGVSSPVTVEELLKYEPQEKVEWLLTYRGEAFLGPSREGLLVTVSEAVAKDFSWSAKLVAAIEAANAWSADLWACVVRGWRQSTLGEAEWEQVLGTLLAEPERTTHVIRELAELLLEGLRREEGAIPLAALPLAEQIADLLWPLAEAEQQEEELTEDSDWLSKAINRPPGSIVTFWLRALSTRRSADGERWAGIPTEFKGRFERILQGGSFASQLGRVVLSSQLHFLFSLDAEWATSHILPLLDWRTDQRQAQQAWHGYLASGRWTEASLPYLLPYYRAAFPNVALGLGKLRGQFAEHMASIAVFSSYQPIQGGGEWLIEFIAAVEPEDRRIWASHMSHQLRLLHDQFVPQLWNRWLSDYWGLRLSGTPLPLMQEELEAMLGWLTHIKPVFSEAVDRFCSGPAAHPRHTTLYHELVEGDFVSSHPEEVARLLTHVLGAASEPFLYCNDAISLARGLIGSSVPRQTLLAICNRLAALACRDASSLASQLS